MKKITVVLFIYFVSVAASAQSVVVSFLDKYGEDDNIQVVSIGKKMFSKMSELSLGNSELQEAIKGLDNIQIITSEDSVLNDEYYDSACAILSKKEDFIELYSMENEGQQMVVKMKESKGIVTELVMLSCSQKHFNMTFITGSINLEMLAKYSSKVDFKELERLNYIENKN